MRWKRFSLLFRLSVARDSIVLTGNWLITERKLKFFAPFRRRSPAMGISLNGSCFFGRRQTNEILSKSAISPAIGWSQKRRLHSSKGRKGAEQKTLASDLKYVKHCSSFKWTRTCSSVAEMHASEREPVYPAESCRGKQFIMAKRRRRRIKKYQLFPFFRAACAFAGCIKRNRAHKHTPERPCVYARERHFNSLCEEQFFSLSPSHTVDQRTCVAANSFVRSVEGPRPCCYATECISICEIRDRTKQRAANAARSAAERKGGKRGIVKKRTKSEKRNAHARAVRGESERERLSEQKSRRRARQKSVGLFNGRKKKTKKRKIHKKYIGLHYRQARSPYAHLTAPKWDKRVAYETNIERDNVTSSYCTVCDGLRAMRRASDMSCTKVSFISLRFWLKFDIVAPISVFISDFIFSRMQPNGRMAGNGEWYQPIGRRAS